ELRIDLRKRFVIDAEALGDTGAIVLEEHISSLDQIKQNLLTIRRFEIDGQRTLVTVERQEGHIDLIAFRTASCDVTLPLARGRLHLDDIRSKVAKTLRRKRPGHCNRAIQNTVA